MNKQTEITPEAERLMRLIANHMLDRIFEDKKNNALKFRPDSKDKLGNVGTCVINNEIVT